MQTLNAALLRFAREVLPLKKEKTQEEYKRQLRILSMTFGHMRLSAIKPCHVEEFLHLRRAKVAANREKALLSSVFNYARRCGLTAAPNPCAGIRNNRELGRTRYIEHAEFLRLVNAADEILRHVLLLAYYTGQRPGDLLDLKRSDVAHGVLTFAQQKTGKVMKIKICGHLEGVIAYFLSARDGKSSDFLILNERGERFGRGALRTRFRKLREKTGLKNIQFRDLRAKTATDIAQDSGLVHAQKLLGHSRVAMTEHYIKNRAQAVEPITRSPLQNRPEW